MTALVALVLLLLAVASLIAARQAYSQSTQHYRAAIACPMAIAAWGDLMPHGYIRLATHYRTEYFGPGYMLSVPVAYTFINRVTGSSRTVHCLGAPRVTVRPAP